MTARLFHVFSSFGPGGPQVRCASMFNRWGRAAVHTIMAMDGRISAAERLNSDVEVRFVVPPIRKRLAFYPFELRKAIVSAKPDLVVTYNWGAIEATFACTFSGLCPVVHLEHGFGVDEAQSLKWRRVIARRLVLNRAQATIVPSRELLDIALKQYRVVPEKVHWIPNGVDIKKFKPERNWELRRSLGLADSDIVLLSVGHLRPVKALDFLLRTFAKSSRENVKLMVVGDGECRSELEQLANTLNITDRLRFLGEAANPLPFYRAADAFVLSSKTEQMPMALLEAMACGLPVVATDVGDVAEILAPHPGNQIVVSDNFDAYARALNVMTSAAADRAAAGTANRTRCVNLYSMERMIRAYSQIYSSVARCPGLLASIEPDGAEPCVPVLPTQESQLAT